MTIVRWAAAAAFLGLTACCQISIPPCLPADAGIAGYPVCVPDAGPPSFAIDAGFLFGATTAAYAVEGGNDGADWSLWERVPLDGGSCTKILHCDRADDGPDGYGHFAQDLAQAKSLGLNAYRFSIEWSRVEPVEGSYDAAAIAHYHELLAACRADGLTPMVTLSDVTLPQWLHGVRAGADGSHESDWSGGWRGLPFEPPGPGARIVLAFGKFAGDMAKEYGSEVDLWVTLEEPTVEWLLAYVQGYFPPGASLHLTDARNALVNLAYANAAAYDAIHGNDLAAAADGGIPALVGIAQQFRVLLLDPAADPTSGPPVRDRMDALLDWEFLGAIVNGDLDTHFDGSFSHPGDPEGEGQAVAALAGRADFVGVDYYGTQLVTPVAGGLPDAQGSSLVWPATLEENPDPAVPHGDPPQGIQLHPGGLHDVLAKVSAAMPLLPIYVTENGVADASGRLGPGDLVEHLQALQQAMAEGADVRGYFRWSLLDGFQWEYGFAPRYGLLSVDFTDPARPRTVTPAAQAYQAIIAAGGVTPAIVSKWDPPPG